MKLEQEPDNLSQKKIRKKDESNLAGRLYIRRNQLNLSCNAVATKAGITPSCYSQYELNKRKNMSSRYLFSLADALGCTAEWLWVGPGYKANSKTIDAQNQTQKNEMVDTNIQKHTHLDDESTFSGRLHIRRRQLKLTGYAVAKKAGITPASYSRYESGVASGMNASTVFALADVLECDVRWLWLGNS